MELSIFLAKVMGLYFVFTSLFYLYRRDIIERVFNDFYSSPALVAVTGVLNIILGLLIVVSHNVWELNYKVILTLVGYLSLFKGVMHIYAPEWGKGISKKLSQGTTVLMYSGLATLLIGVYLVYVGFFR